MTLFLDRLRIEAAETIMESEQGGTVFGWYRRAGSPEGAVTANPGSLCVDPTGPAVYLKEVGTGNTGWIPLVASKVITVNSVGHGLTRGQAVDYDGIAGTIAATHADENNYTGIVSRVIDANQVEYTPAFGGCVSWPAHGFTDPWMYLGNNANGGAYQTAAEGDFPVLALFVLGPDTVFPVALGAGNGLTDAQVASLHDAVTIAAGRNYVTLAGQELTLNAVDTDDLINGTAAPGNSKYFGTSSGGVKGFHDLPVTSNGETAAVTGALTVGDPVTFDGTTATLTNSNVDAYFGVVASSGMVKAAGTGVLQWAGHGLTVGQVYALSTTGTWVLNTEGAFPIWGLRVLSANEVVVIATPG